jgi:hypothetical protein
MALINAGLGIAVLSDVGEATLVGGSLLTPAGVIALSVGAATGSGDARANTTIIKLLRTVTVSGARSGALLKGQRQSINLSAVRQRVTLEGNWETDR